jgi:Cys-rich four helix bundle protein (predicted Tat secretion target)
MKRREFLVGLGAAAAVASASQVLAQGAGAPASSEMHPPKYMALEETSARCVATGDDCLRHCFGMLSMNDTSMAGCTKAAYDVIAGCGALHSLAAVNSPHTPALAKAVADMCTGCQKECEKFPNVPECKACGEACANCAQECMKVAA